MENIKYILEVHLIEHPISGFSKRNEGIFYPFNNVEILVNEIQICPFCGRPVRAFNCNCGDFQVNLEKMQSFYKDDEHKSQLYSSNINPTVVLSKPISDFQFRALEINEISNLGPNFWDFIGIQVDSLSSGYYKVSPVVHDDDGYFFVCKNLISKCVYRFEVSAIEYKDKQISLGVYTEDVVPNLDASGRIPGNYHFECFWKNIVSFDNWNVLCANIKSF